MSRSLSSFLTRIRKEWILSPVRKFTGSKVGKNQLQLQKKGSDKKFKSSVSDAIRSISNKDEQNGEEPDDELPPPMKPISDSILVNASDSTITALQREDALQKRECVIRELVETERDYVRDLSLVVEGYMTVMRDPEAAGCDIPVPKDLRSGKAKIIFGNIELIYKWHRDVFLSAIDRCLTQPHELGQLFKRYERTFLMYVYYCPNKPVSEYLVSEHDYYFEEMRQFFGYKLQLCDILIKPVQRIMKYQLLLRDIFKYTERARLVDEMEALRQAMHVMHVVAKAANDMMYISRLQGFDGKITAQGKLLLHGMLTCAKHPCYNPNRVPYKELHVFLFEQSIIFSEEVGKKTQFTSPVYVYKAHIQVNKMSLKERHGSSSSNSSDDSSDGSFIIKSTDPRKPQLWFVCHAHSAESRSEWLQNLRQILKTQRDFLNALESPIAHINRMSTMEAISALLF